jgi:hypothetical protein
MGMIRMSLKERGGNFLIMGRMVRQKGRVIKDAMGGGLGNDKKAQDRLEVRLGTMVLFRKMRAVPRSEAEKSKTGNSGCQNSLRTPQK